MGDAFRAAFELIRSADAELIGIIGLSLRVSFSALLCAALIALPAGAALGVLRFPGRRALLVVLNTLMGLPPVVGGLVVYLLLSRQGGPFGEWGLLFTPAAMMIAQTLLITPLIAALTRQVIEERWEEYGEQLRSLGAGRWRAVGTLLFEARVALLTVLLAGLGRAIAEVGAVQLVGGNIRHVTRVMTTTIALDTSRGELHLALGLGMVLMTLALLIYGTLELVGEGARRVRG